MKKIVILKNDAFQRVDRFLTKHLPRANKNFIMKMIRKKNITLNDKKIEPDYILKENDEIKIYFSDDTYKKFRPSEKVFSHVKLDIVYEDDDIIVLDKESGLLSHVAKNLKEKNLIDGVIKYLIEKREYIPNEENSFVPALCNRLDRNTSGLIIVGKNSLALKTINDKIKNKEIEKYYYAIVHGEFTFSGILEDKFTRNDKKNVSKITNSGKNMIGEYNVVKSHKDYSLVKIKLITGRTHQIRAQLANLKHPIIGDKKYGSSYYTGKDGQYLVSAELVFPSDIELFPNLSDKTFVSKYKKKLFNDFERLIR